MIRLHNAWERIQRRKKRKEERAAEGKSGKGHPNSHPSGMVRESDMRAFENFRKQNKLN